MDDSSSRYLHGTSPDEQRRLSILNDTINATSLREIGPRESERILDLGCGLGQLTRLLARAAGPTGRVVGVERDADQIARARALAQDAGEDSRMEIRQGDGAAPPLRDDEWGTFDVAHARFLLEHVRDPVAVVRAMVRAVRPGGRIVLEDDDHDLLRFFPEPEGATDLWEAYLAAFESNGNDPRIGRRLPWLLSEAGARPRRNTWHFYGACGGTPEMAAVAENMVGLWAGARDAMVATGRVTARQFDAGVAAFRTWSETPGAALWYGISWAEGAR